MKVSVLFAVPLRGNGFEKIQRPSGDAAAIHKAQRGLALDDGDAGAGVALAVIQEKVGTVAVALEVVREGGAEAVESHRPPVGRAVSFMGVEREIAVARIVFQKDEEAVCRVHLDAADGDVPAVLALVDVAIDVYKRQPGQRD